MIENSSFSFVTLHNKYFDYWQKNKTVSFLWKKDTFDRAIVITGTAYRRLIFALTKEKRK